VDELRPAGKKLVADECDPLLGEVHDYVAGGVAHPEMPEFDLLRPQVDVHLVTEGDFRQKRRQFRVFPVGGLAPHVRQHHLDPAPFMADESRARGQKPVPEHMVAVGVRAHHVHNGIICQLTDFREHLRDRGLVLFRVDEEHPVFADIRAAVRAPAAADFIEVAGDVVQGDGGGGLLGEGRGNGNEEKRE